MTDRISYFSGGQILAVYALGSAALLVVGIQPVLFGTLLESGILDLPTLSCVATLETITSGCAIVVASALFPLTRVRAVGIIALLCFALANAISALALDLMALLTARIAAGFAAGVCIWLTTSMIVRTAKPERLYGYFVSVHTLAQGIAVAILALLIVPEFGWRGCFALVAVAGLFPLVCSRLIPAELSPLPRPSEHDGKLTPAMAIAALVTLLQMIMTIAIWAFLEPMGRLTGIEPQTLQLIVSGLLFFQVLAAAFAGFVAPHLPTLGAQFITSGSIFILSFYLLTIAQWSSHWFAPTAILFSFCWIMILPLQTKLAIDVDPTGRLALSVPAIQIVGSAIAPIAAGFAAGTGPVSGVALVAIVCGGVTLLALLVLGVWRNVE
ncbi:MAG: MFS transporter [Pseudomonadota bacterium]